MKDPLILAYYNDVKREHYIMPKAKETKVISDLEDKRNELRALILSQPEAAEFVISTIDNAANQNKSIAKFSRDFNTKKEGQVKKLKLNLLSNIKQLKFHLEKREFKIVSDILYNCNLSDDFIFNEIPKNIDPPSSRKKQIEKLETEILSLEKVLINSALQAAVEVGLRYGSLVFGIDVKDAIQEANIGLLEAARLYRSDFRNANGTRTKFITYAYSKCEHAVKEWIMNSSRTIRIPKNQLEKIFSVIEASKLFKDKKLDVGLLVKETNSIRKKKNKKELTKEEVEKCIGYMQITTLNIDQEISSGKPWERHRTIGESIADESQDPERDLDSKRLNEKIQTLLTSSNLSKIERMIIELRFLNYKTKQLVPYETIGQMLKEHTGNSMSREWVRKTEMVALSKLKDNANDLFDLLETT